MQGSSQHGLESLKGELKIRDELVQKLRQEILDLQERRDQALSEVCKFLFLNKIPKIILEIYIP